MTLSVLATIENYMNIAYIIVSCSIPVVVSVSGSVEVTKYQQHISLYEIIILLVQVYYQGEIFHFHES
jgi:hypothetical protein